MNNPALPIYASQNPGSYTFNNSQPGAVFSIPPGTPFDHAQTPFQPGMIPDHMQRPSHPQQAQHPIPQNFYQQHPGQAGPFPRPDSRSNYSLQHQGRPSNGPTPIPVTLGVNQTLPTNPSLNLTTSAPPLSSTSAPFDFNMAANIATQVQHNPTLAQQAQIQNAAQLMRAAPQPQQQQAAGSVLSPQSAARERARVTVLLDINTQLLQEVVSLQTQGKAGSAPSQGQQSPTSPTSATDPANALNNSPGDPPKSAGVGASTTPSKPPSHEYADCMRRLQANLSYLAAVADAKKKVNGALPSGPAIMVPPAHLPQVHELYKKLNALFPEAGHTTINKAVAFAAGQNQNAASKPQQPASVPTQS